MMTINYLPEFDHSGKEKHLPQTGIIRDLLVGIQIDQCTQEACPSLRMLIDLPEKSIVVILCPTTLKNFISLYKRNLSSWIGKEVSVCYSSKDGKRDKVRVFPIIC